MNKTAQGILFAIAALGLASSAALISVNAQTIPPKSNSPQTPAQAAPAGKPKVSEEVFKNIQVLKGVPVDQWLPTMQFMATSLGVECEFCHVGQEREKDDKKNKLTARKMILMTNMLNKDVPEVES
ncbi:MAG TPA: photosynthetic reaction center cytochrome c subunit family protein, partial [Candidatus Acidoferrales bacterium]|nr:photosynthetic reaction center cytochrome c subunit family protein [Candidatus Acidoferrales bacterium]